MRLTTEPEPQNVPRNVGFAGLNAEKVAPDCLKITADTARLGLTRM